MVELSFISSASTVLAKYSMRFRHHTFATCHVTKDNNSGKNVPSRFSSGTAFILNARCQTIKLSRQLGLWGSHVCTPTDWLREFSRRFPSDQIPFNKPAIIVMCLLYFSGFIVCAMLGNISHFKHRLESFKPPAVFFCRAFDLMAELAKKLEHEKVRTRARLSNE